MQLTDLVPLALAVVGLEEALVVRNTVLAVDEPAHPKRLVSKILGLIGNCRELYQLVGKFAAELN